jgi:hypothetical protein
VHAVRAQTASAFVREQGLIWERGKFSHPGGHDRPGILAQWCSAGQSCRALPVTLSGGFGPAADLVKLSSSPIAPAGRLDSFPATPAAWQPGGESLTDHCTQRHPTTSVGCSAAISKAQLRPLRPRRLTQGSSASKIGSTSSPWR